MKQKESLKIRKNPQQLKRYCPGVIRRENLANSRYDHTAQRVQPDTFAKYFIDYYYQNNPGVSNKNIA